MAWDDFDFRKGPGGGFGRPPFRLPPLRLGQISPQHLGTIIRVMVMVWFASGSYIVGPDQRGIVLRFGKHVATTDPGFHWHWPYPFETVLRPKVTEVQRVELGFHSIDPTPPARYADVPSESLMLTGDENIIDIDLVVQYRIADPVNAQAVYGRMRTEREREAKRYRSEGQEEALKIRAESEKQKTIMLAEAYEQEQVIGGEGDAVAMRIYAEAFQHDPEFFNFTRTLEAYRKSLTGKTTLLLPPQMDFLKYLHE